MSYLMLLYYIYGRERYKLDLAFTGIIGVLVWRVDLLLLYGLLILELVLLYN